MTGVATYRRPWAARIVLALALVAALARAAVPVGFMPTARDGVLQVVICGAEGAPSHALIDLGGGEQAPAPQAAEHCVFAVAAAATPSAMASIAAPVRAVVDAAHGHLPDLAPGRGLAAPPPPSHAPPVLI
ncbi:MAG: hypothetical protein NW200_14790 [Hyphomonadaceae bacterium]|nr:hypothetical protein [Hyphomonadaceae bacterium]